MMQSLLIVFLAFAVPFAFIVGVVGAFVFLCWLIEKID